MKQDGAHTDERPEIGSPLIVFKCLHPRAAIVLRTLLVADIGLLLATGTLLAMFMEHPAGFIFGGCCWTLATLASITRWLARRER